MKRALLILMLLMSGVPAWAATCGDRAVILEQLADRFGEGLVAQGLTASGDLMDLLVAPDTGTWTLLWTGPGRPSCVVASGGAFQPVAEFPPKGDPA